MMPAQTRNTYYNYNTTNSHSLFAFNSMICFLNTHQFRRSNDLLLRSNLQVSTFGIRFCLIQTGLQQVQQQEK